MAGRTLADQKLPAIFLMLSGAGIVLMAGRAEARGGARRTHYRRMGWLLVIGLLHAHLLWPGDILFLYAVCGMLVYPSRRQPVGRLLALGVVLFTVGSTISVASGLSFPYWPERERAAFTADAWEPRSGRRSSSPRRSGFRRFRFGPAEWAWRWLTYGERPPLRRTPAPEPSR